MDEYYLPRDDLKEGRLCGTYADASRAQRQCAPLSSRPFSTGAGHPRFYELLKRMAEVHDAKNHDYSGDKDPLRNLRQCGDAGVEPWVGVIVRLTDKMDRLKTFASKRRFEVKDESLADTFVDMANYALLGLILFEEWVSTNKQSSTTES